MDTYQSSRVSMVNNTQPTPHTSHIHTGDTHTCTTKCIVNKHLCTHYMYSSIQPSASQRAQGRSHTHPRDWHWDITHDSPDGKRQRYPVPWDVFPPCGLTKLFGLLYVFGELFLLLQLLNHFHADFFLCVCVPCVCVSAPRLLKTIHVKWILNNQLNKLYCFSVSLYGTCHRYCQWAWP